MNQLSDPIAVFDSGMGGISVLREMTKLMPNEDFIYYGDSKHAPYGTKTLEEVRALTIEHITYLIKEKHAKAVAVACNTATSAAVRILRDMYPDLPLVGVEPAIKPAVLATGHAKVVVMATPMNRQTFIHCLVQALWNLLNRVFYLAKNLKPFSITCLTHIKIKILPALFLAAPTIRS